MEGPVPVAIKCRHVIAEEQSDAKAASFLSILSKQGRWDLPSQKLLVCMPTDANRWVYPIFGVWGTGEGGLLHRILLKWGVVALSNRVILPHVARGIEGSAKVGIIQY